MYDFRHIFCQTHSFMCHFGVGFCASYMFGFETKTVSLSVKSGPTMLIGHIYNGPRNHMLQNNFIFINVTLPNAAAVVGSVCQNIWCMLYLFGTQDSITCPPYHFDCPCVTSVRSVRPGHQPHFALNMMRAIRCVCNPCATLFHAYRYTDNLRSTSPIIFLASFILYVINTCTVFLFFLPSVHHSSPSVLLFLQPTSSFHPHLPFCNNIIPYLLWLLLNLECPFLLAHVTSPKPLWCH